MSTTYITRPEEITYSDTEYIRIDIPDSVIEFLQSCESDDRLVEVEAFVTGKSLGRQGKRVAGGNPIRATFEWNPVGVKGVLNKSFNCWLNGEEVGPGIFYGQSPYLGPKDRLQLHLLLEL